MNISKKLLALLALFCVIVSAGAVCAADNSAYVGLNYIGESGYAGSQYQDGGYAGSQYEDGGYAGSQYQDEGGYAGSQYQDEGGWAGSQYNETAENAAAANQTAQNTTNQTVQNATSNQTAPNATTVQALATEDANSTTGHSMLSTGNPIILLIGACSLLGGAAALRRRK